MRTRSHEIFPPHPPGAGRRARPRPRSSSARRLTPVEEMPAAGGSAAPSGRSSVTVQAEGGHYTLVTVETNQVGESEADKLAKRFLTVVHTLADPAHRADRRLLSPTDPGDFTMNFPHGVRRSPCCSCCCSVRGCPRRSAAAAPGCSCRPAPRAPAGRRGEPPAARPQPGQLPGLHRPPDPALRVSWCACWACSSAS